MNKVTILAAIWILLSGAVSPTLGQTATLTVSHDDPDGIVTPGQTVRIKATLAWTGQSGFGYAIGSVRVTDDAGTASNPSFPYNFLQGPATVVQPGTPAGGSILDVVIQSGDVRPWFGSPPLHPWGLQTGLVLTQYDWTAPTTAGVLEFQWIPGPANPLPVVVLYSTGSSLAIPTTYFGTSLTVVPAPASALLFASGMLAALRRQRPGALRHSRASCGARPHLDCGHAWDEPGKVFRVRGVETACAGGLRG